MCVQRCIWQRPSSLFFPTPPGDEPSRTHLNAVVCTWSVIHRLPPRVPCPYAVPGTGKARRGQFRSQPAHAAGNATHEAKAHLAHLLDLLIPLQLDTHGVFFTPYRGGGVGDVIPNATGGNGPTAPVPNNTNTPSGGTIQAAGVAPDTTLLGGGGNTTADMAPQDVRRDGGAADGGGDGPNNDPPARAETDSGGGSGSVATHCNARVTSQWSGSMRHLNSFFAVVEDPVRAASPPTSAQLAHLTNDAGAASDCGKLGISDHRIVMDHDALGKVQAEGRHTTVNTFYSVINGLKQYGDIRQPGNAQPHGNIYLPGNPGKASETPPTQTTASGAHQAIVGSGQGLHQHGTAGRYKFEGAAGNPFAQREYATGWHTVQIGMRVSASDGHGGGVSGFAIRVGGNAPVSVASLHSYSWWAMGRLAAGEYEVTDLADPAARVGDHSAGIVTHGVPNADAWRATFMLKLEVKATDEQSAVCLLAQRLAEVIQRTWDAPPAQVRWQPTWAGCCVAMPLLAHAVHSANPPHLMRTPTGHRRNSSTLGSHGGATGLRDQNLLPVCQFPCHRQCHR